MPPTSAHGIISQSLDYQPLPTLTNRQRSRIPAISGTDMTAFLSSGFVV